MIPGKMNANDNQTSFKEVRVRATNAFWDRTERWRSHFGATTDSDLAKALINFAISELERQQNPSTHGGDGNGNTG